MDEQEEQKRVSNRETCRDELLALLREVSDIKQSLSSKATAAQNPGEFSLELNILVSQFLAMPSEPV